ncbi:hypothetical protein ACIO3O_36810 [Streptomyces sp. NPDC087440]|uniref:hypothetical protein n=1 Tax=Streptomyces sp. NPDC087440 TaxID=3365790 RepID=UPI0037FCA17F
MTSRTTMADHLRVVEARDALDEAIEDIRRTFGHIPPALWPDLGTPDLVTAVDALFNPRGGTPRQQEEWARQLSASFTINPAYLYGQGIDALAFGTAVLWLRLVLRELDDRRNLVVDLLESEER